MSSNAAPAAFSNVVPLQERRLDRTVLRTYQKTADIYEIVPNNNQLRMGPKTTKSCNGKLRLTAGCLSRFSSSRILTFQRSSALSPEIDAGQTRAFLSSKAKNNIGKYRLKLPTARLPRKTGLRVCIYIHRQRKEWDAKEKEMVAYRLVDMMGRASAVNIPGITVRELGNSSELRSDKHCKMHTSPECEPGSSGLGSGLLGMSSSSRWDIETPIDNRS
jgi:ParB family transcriptional regulator, chromosome partitioning protein